MVSHPPGHSLLTFCPSPAMAKAQRGDRSFQGAVGFRKCLRLGGDGRGAG